MAKSRRLRLLDAVVLFAALFAPAIVWAQQTQNQGSSATPSSIPADVADKLANDLAQFQAGVQATERIASSTPEWNQLQVTSSNANVFSGVSASKPVEFVAQKGQKFRILDKVSDLYAVAADDGRTGWIPARDVRLESNVVPDKGYPMTKTGAPVRITGAPGFVAYPAHREAMAGLLASGETHNKIAV
jgi:hypothetical protein